MLSKIYNFVLSIAKFRQNIISRIIHLIIVKKQSPHEQQPDSNSGYNFMYIFWSILFAGYLYIMYMFNRVCGKYRQQRERKIEATRLLNDAVSLMRSEHVEPEDSSSSDDNDEVIREKFKRCKCKPKCAHQHKSSNKSAPKRSTKKRSKSKDDSSPSDAHGSVYVQRPTAHKPSERHGADKPNARHRGHKTKSVKLNAYESVAYQQVTLQSTSFISNVQAASTSKNAEHKPSNCDNDDTSSSDSSSCGYEYTAYQPKVNNGTTFVDKSNEYELLDSEPSSSGSSPNSPSTSQKNLYDPSTSKSQKMHSLRHNKLIITSATTSRNIYTETETNEPLNSDIVPPLNIPITETSDETRSENSSNTSTAYSNSYTERQHELIINDSNGRIIKKIPFRECDYNEAWKTALREDYYAQNSRHKD